MQFTLFLCSYDEIVAAKMLLDMVDLKGCQVYWYKIDVGQL